MSDTIKEILDEEKNLDPKVRKLIEKTLSEITVNKKSPLQALHLHESDLELIYVQAHSLFQASNYAVALPILKLLCRLNPDDVRFHIGLGGCFQMLGNFSNAIYPYLKAIEIDENSPLPYFYLTEIFLKLKNKPLAASAIDTLYRKFGLNPLYKKFLERYKLVRESLGPPLSEKMLQEEVKENRAAFDAFIKEL